MTLGEKQQLYVGKTPVHQIRNRNEERVFQVMPAVLQALDYEPDSLDVQAIYALVLNKLPLHYVQETAIVRKESVDEQTIQMAIREGAEQV
ncbi:MAG TPA: competence protein ComFB [Candidatus Handelsmanbacteria bacterium]|jgi:hypothetical protein|nr:competence protein ComFB [Candidatus Handelsmanbacteria bacterium]